MPDESTILVVDDEAELCDILKKVLTKEGYHTLTARTGKRALTLLKQEDVRLILLDLKMPGMDGLEILGKIKKMKDRPTPVVVILTAHGSLSSAREAMQLGAVDYITKPFDLDMIKAVVKEALGET